MATKLEHLSQFEEETTEAIDELIPGYLNDDWEDEFDDINEAYEEQGRGEAESQAILNLIRREYPDGMSDDELVELMDQLADLWSLSFN